MFRNKSVWGILRESIEKMKFVETLLKDINLQKKIGEGVISKIRTAPKIVLWGTGIAGQTTYKNLCEMGIEISSFSDNNKSKWNTRYLDIDVISPDSIDKKSLVIICANVKYNIHLQLKKMGINNYVYIDPEYFKTLPNDGIVEKIIQNTEQIEQVYSMISDEASKRVYRNVLLHRAIHNLELIWEIYNEHQYFGNGIVDHVKGGIVDCGAFDGDTLRRFLSQVGEDDYQYFAFEADMDNYNKLKRYCEQNDLSKVHCFNLGVWDQKTELYFTVGDNEVSGTLIDDSNSNKKKKIEVDSIDHIIGEQKINLITMDIEGSEIKALEGAKQTIRKNRPTLAVSVYHKLEHLWEIPLLIRQIDSGYDIYFAHHCWNMDDTVCYAKERIKV